jgi:hypothetical protein
MRISKSHILVISTLSLLGFVTASDDAPYQNQFELNKFCDLNQSVTIESLRALNTKLVRELVQLRIEVTNYKRLFAEQVNAPLNQLLHKTCNSPNGNILDEFQGDETSAWSDILSGAPSLKER